MLYEFDQDLTNQLALLQLLHKLELRNLKRNVCFHHMLLFFLLVQDIVSMARHLIILVVFGWIYNDEAKAR